MSEATPRPWTQSHRQGPDGMYRTQVYDGLEEEIATLAWHPVPTEIGTATDRSANAEFIVRAVNSHDALVAALRDLLADGTGSPKSCGCPYTCIHTGDNARAALKLAGAE